MVDNVTIDTKPNWPTPKAYRVHPKKKKIKIYIQLLMEDIAIIFRKEFWSTPCKINWFITNKIMKKIISLLKFKYKIIAVGIIFCHFNITKSKKINLILQLLKVIPNQKWNTINLIYINSGNNIIRILFLIKNNIDLLLIDVNAWI